MNRRLLTAAIAMTLAGLATPAVAAFQFDDHPGRGYGYNQESDPERVERSQEERPSAAPRRRPRQDTGRRAPQRGTADRSVTGFARGAGSSRACLTSAARALLGRIEARFGSVQVISTCRPGARVASTGRTSKHASGEAIDFNVGGRKGEIVRWLIANHKSGGTMTYAGMSHIHVDVGYHFVALNSGGRRRR